MENRLVSIVIPVLNSADYIEECLNSVINQTYKNIEIIIVDNNSTDNSLNIANNYASKDSRIKVLIEKNRGVAYARKLGIDNSNGEYICSIDSDDYIEPNYIQILLSNIVKNNSDIVQCGFRYENYHNKEVSFKEYNIDITNNKEEFIKKWIIADGSIGSQIYTKLFKADVLKKTFNQIPIDINEGEDQIYFIYYIKNASSICSISDILYHYRYREDSLSHKINIKWLITELSFINRLNIIIKNQYPLFDKELLNRFIRKYKSNRINDYINYLKTK